MKLGCAGKVFIAGEYACLEGGPSVLGTIAPAFTLECLKSSTSTKNQIPFAEGSPAQIYLSQHAQTLEGYRLEWRDPYATPIGVGSSSAQFILSVALVRKLQGLAPLKPQEVLSLYWETVGTSQGLRPSGVDVVAQWLGGPLVVRNEPFASQQLTPWKGESSFLLAFTGSKAKTHEHLKMLRERGFPGSFRELLGQLNQLTLRVIEAWATADAQSVGSTLNQYQGVLNQAELATSAFIAQVEKIQKWPGVFGCKGTGAQGGDCALLLIKNTQVSEISSKISALGWQPISMDWMHQGVVELSE